jgi:hypothetical protein
VQLERRIGKSEHGLLQRNIRRGSAHPSIGTSKNLAFLSVAPAVPPFENQGLAGQLRMIPESLLDPFCQAPGVTSGRVFGP